MTSKHITILSAAIGMALGLGACTDGYGYSGVSLGYGSPSGYYGDGYYGDAGYGYAYGAPSYFGWYGDYYYPGSGVYVYDRDRRPHRWNGTQQRYWSQQQRYRGNGAVRGSWAGFDRGRNANGWQDRRNAAGVPQRSRSDWRSRGDRSALRQQDRAGQYDAAPASATRSPDAATRSYAPSAAGDSNTVAPSRSYGGNRGQGRGNRAARR